MALRFGWRAADKRDTIWIGDESLQDVPTSAKEDWQKDGDAVHLRNYATAGQPTIFTFRALNCVEAEYVKGLHDSANPLASFYMIATFCFRLAVRFKDAPETYMVPSTGAGPFKVIERVSGFPMLADGFCNSLRCEYPGMIEFYGAKIWEASQPTEPEKKASSPPLTPPPSSVEGSSTATTAATGAPAEAGV